MLRGILVAAGALVVIAGIATLLALPRSELDLPPPFPAGTDAFGDPLPPWAIARIGSARFSGASSAPVFTTDGVQVVVGSSDGFLRWYDVATGALVREVAAHTDCTQDGIHRSGRFGDEKIAVPDGVFRLARLGARLFSAGGNRLRAFDLATGERIGEVDAFAWGMREGPDGNVVFWTPTDLFAWDGMGARADRLGATISRGVIVDASPDLGGRVVFNAAAPPGEAAGEMRVLDVARGVDVPLTAPFADAMPRCFSPDGAQLVWSAPDAGTLALTRSADGEIVWTSTPHESRTGGFRWSDDGALLVAKWSAGADVLDARTGARIARIPGRWPTGIGFDAGRTRMALVSNGGVRVIDTATWRDLHPEVPDLHASEFAWTPDGAAVATCAGAAELAFFSPRSGCETRRISLPGHADHVSFDAAGARTLAADRQAAWIIDPADGRVLDASPDAATQLPFAARTVPQELRPERTFLAGSVSADGRRAAVWTGWNRCSLRVHDLAGGRVVMDLELYAQLNHHEVALSSDGSLLAARHEDGTRTRIFDVAQGRQVALLEGHRGDAWTLAFSPTEPLLAVGGDGAILVYDLSGLSGRR